MGVRKNLRKALKKQRMVRIDFRPRHADRVAGFVVGLGEKWALVAETSDGGYPDGFTAFASRMFGESARTRRSRGTLRGLCPRGRRHRRRST